jgi:capsid protein
MDPTVLAWALAQPAGIRAAVLAAAFTVGTGLTYDQVAGDLTQANYSSLRAGRIEFRRLCEQVQYGMLIPMLVWPIADRFHAQGPLLGLWDAEAPSGVSHVPPAHETIDPLKDTTALIAQVRAASCRSLKRSGPSAMTSAKWLRSSARRTP